MQAKEFTFNVCLLFYYYFCFSCIPKTAGTLHLLKALKKMFQQSAEYLLIN